MKSTRASSCNRASRRRGGLCPSRPQTQLGETERREIIMAAKRPDFPAEWRRRELNPRNIPSAKISAACRVFPVSAPATRRRVR
jgi:hypothetical protein